MKTSGVEHVKWLRVHTESQIHEKLVDNSRLFLEHYLQLQDWTIFDLEKKKKKSSNSTCTGLDVN